jgi:hypothetical protein
VPAKSSETRAILLLIFGDTEHLWIQIKIVFAKAKMSSKKSSDRIVAKQISYATTTPSKIRSRNWRRSPKRKSFVVNIRKPMSESFGLIPKRETPVDKIAKLTKRTVGALRQKALKLGIGLGHQR